MSDSLLVQQNILLENRERILSALKKYPNVVSVGVGLKETNDEITSTLCYRIYVGEKKSIDELEDFEKIPRVIDGFVTDVISYGVIHEAADLNPVRPLKGGIQIKNDSYQVDNDRRGVGTLGCLAIPNEDVTRIVALTCAHVAFLNSESPRDSSPNIGQPQKHVCCCCCVKNLIGSVDKVGQTLDCASIALHDDIIEEIKTNGIINEVQGLGYIIGRQAATVGLRVMKVGAGTGLTIGQVVDIHFDDGQILVAPAIPYVTFAGFGDSGSIVVDENYHAVGLLWGTKRDRFKSDDLSVTPNEDPRSDENQQHRIKRRTRGVVTPIQDVEAALNVKLPVPPNVKGTISIHSDDTKTFAVPSTLPGSKTQHFVTVKGDGDIILKATFDQPVENDRIKWVSDWEDITSPAIADDNTTAKISRTPNDGHGSRTEVGVTVDGFGIGAKVIVWIVWSSYRSVDSDPTLTVKTDNTEIKSTITHAVQFTVEPNGIIPKDIATADVPDFRGANVTPPPNVPDTDTDVYNQGVDLSESAKYKWDTTAALKYKIINDQNFFLDPALPVSKPFPNYPSNDLVGNFETTTSDFETDPYGSVELPGVFTKAITFEHSLPNSIANFQGRQPDKTEIKFLYNYKLFARLEINGVWHIISDPALAFTALKYLFGDEFNDNKDYDEDGDKLDKVWYGILDPQNCFTFIGGNANTI